MAGLDPRIFKAAWTLFVFALLLAGLYTIRDTIVLFALALFFAKVLEPVIHMAGRFAPRRFSRLALLGVVYLGMLGLIIGVLIPLASSIGEEAAGLAARLPDVLKQDPVGSLPLPGWLESVRPRLAELLQDRMQELGKDVLPMLTRAGTQIVSGLGNVLSLILIPILGFFFLKDGTELRGALVSLFSHTAQATVNDILLGLNNMLARYIQALVLLSLATFVSHTAIFTLLGVPYAILLASIACVLELIPVLGPVTAGAIVLLVAGFSGFPHLLWILVFLLIYRLFQDYVLNPQLMGSGVELHPVLILFGVVAGEQVAGVPGMFFSVPFMAGLRVVLKRLHQNKPIEEMRDAD
jgi:predicted PurR-regulated permease PerM